jgi:hypothetical protein
MLNRRTLEPPRCPPAPEAQSNSRYEPCQNGIGPASASYHLIFDFKEPHWNISMSGAGVACRHAMDRKQLILFAYDFG